MHPLDIAPDPNRLTMTRGEAVTWATVWRPPGTPVCSRELRAAAEAMGVVYTGDDSKQLAILLNVVRSIGLLEIDRAQAERHRKGAR